MSENQNPPGHEPSDAEKDLAEHERPDVGLIGDQDLPEDLRPTDDNPLAQDADEESDQGGPGTSTDKVEGMPDMGGPGSPG